MPWTVLIMNMPPASLSIRLGSALFMSVSVGARDCPRCALSGYDLMHTGLATQLCTPTDIHSVKMGATTMPGEAAMAKVPVQRQPPPDHRSVTSTLSTWNSKARGTAWGSIVSRSSSHRTLVLLLRYLGMPCCCALSCPSLFPSTQDCGFI